MKDLMVCKRTRHPISRSLNSKHDSVENKHHLIETSAIISQVSKSLDSFRLEVMGLDSKGDWQKVGFLNIALGWDYLDAKNEIFFHMALLWESS